jgi:hypothetical protein
MQYLGYEWDPLAPPAQAEKEAGYVVAWTGFGQPMLKPAA